MKKALPSCCVFRDANDGRAKDGESKLAMSERMVGVERVVGGRVACPQPLAAAGAVGGHPFRPRPRHRDHLASRRRPPRRLRRLLLLPCPPWTQGRIGRPAPCSASGAELAVAPTPAGGH